jgi:cob(I)alamin adenosyltransferase
MPEYFTRTGDDGTSGLLGDERVPKDHPRLEAVGTLDEANAALGLVRATCSRQLTAQIILTIQQDLYHIMAEVAATPRNAGRFRLVDESRVAWLEGQIEAIGSQVHMPKDFILPGDTKTGASLAMARTIIRRAERRVCRLVFDSELENPALLAYLNRLSSLCFILELWENTTSSPNPISLAKDKGQ